MAGDRARVPTRGAADQSRQRGDTEGWEELGTGGRNEAEIPTLRQRFLGLAGRDPDRRRAYRRAWTWARQRLADHVVSIGSTEQRLFPPGGLDAADSYTDSELQVFADWLVLASLSYGCFLSR